MGRNRRSAEYKNNSRVIDMEEARRQRLEKRRAEQANIEEQARNQLRLIKPGETLYLFPEEMTEENNSNSSESEDQQ